MSFFQIQKTSAIVLLRENDQSEMKHELSSALVNLLDEPKLIDEAAKELDVVDFLLPFIDDDGMKKIRKAFAKATEMVG